MKLVGRYTGGLTKQLRAHLETAQNQLSSGGTLMTWGGPDGSKLYSFSVDWTKHRGTTPQGTPPQKVNGSCAASMHAQQKQQAYYNQNCPDVT
eukprot:scaffold149265_cov19-Tisochrysis_lutea.AAC.2